MNSNAATGRLVHEELLVGGVHLGEVGHVSQEDLDPSAPQHLLVVLSLFRVAYVDLDDLGHAGAGGVQDGFDVVAAGLGQFADVALDQVGRGVGGDLARDEDLAVGADGLGLWWVSWCSVEFVWFGLGIVHDSGVMVLGNSWFSSRAARRGSGKGL